LDWDEGPDVGGPSAPYSQAERGEFYRTLFARLEAGPRLPLLLHGRGSGAVAQAAAHGGQAAALCGHLPPFDRAQRAEREARGLRPTLRFAVPTMTRSSNSSTWCTGRRRFASGDIGDFIIRREDGTSAFFFCNAVDDSVMGVTQVLRGDDHLTNTPRQLMLLDALGMRRPATGMWACWWGRTARPCRSGMAAPARRSFANADSFPPPCSIICFTWATPAMWRAGCPPADMPAHFHPEHLGRAPARFDESQLMHWQKETLERMSGGEIGRGWAMPRRISSSWCGTISCCRPMPSNGRGGRGELPPLGQEEQRIVTAAGPAFFAAAADAFDQSSSDLKQLTKFLKERTGRKGADLFMPLRVALTGLAHGPELAPLLKLMTAGEGASPTRTHAQNP
jgi:hypothetical protein